MKTMAIKPAADKMRLLRKVVMVLAAAAAFVWLHKHGMSPVLAALVLLFLRSVIRFLFRMICCLMTLAVLIALIMFLLS